MAFFQLILKASKLKRARRIYHDEKLRSIEISRGEKPRYTLSQKIRHQKVLLKRKIRSVLRKLICCPESLWIYKKTVLLKTDGTVENYVLKSVFGFIAGIILTYMFFVFFVFQLHMSLIGATFLCSLFGVCLTIGLAFFPYVRCVVMLFLPIFFSKRGRQALMAYAFILTLAGPARNTLYNLGVLSESLGCVQEQLKEAVQSVIDLIKHPFHALRQTIVRIVKSLKVIVKKIKQMLIAMKRLIVSILQVIESAIEWLGSVLKVCNKEFGTPYDRCQGMFQNAVEGCKKRLGDTVGKVCVVTNVARTVCMPLKPLDAICGLVTYVSNAIADEVREKLKEFKAEIKSMFFVRVKFSHYYHMETNRSKSLGEISREISAEIKRKTRHFLGFFSLAGFLAIFFFVVLWLRVVYYRYKWLTKDRFDNHYLSGYMREIDMRRVKQDKETVFPLNWRERAKYIWPSSILLAKSEKIKLAKSVVFLTITCVKLAIYIAIDYCLYWTLDNIRYHGRNQPREPPRQAYAATVQVKGDGFLADLFRSIAKAFSPYTNSQTDLEIISCLPEPKPPNYEGYVQIAILALFCWIMALFEPYGLRLRHVVLSNYYPDRAKQRAVWLYNNIIRSRGSFLKFARRQLRRKFGTAHNDGIERVTLRERLWAVFPFLNKLAPLKLKNPCVLCGQPERDKSNAPHINCPTPNCVGVYCAQCFQDLKNLCTICMSPMDYGDLTDISEERDSSEEEVDREAWREKIEALRAAKSEADKLAEKEDDSEVVKVKKVMTDDDDDASSKYSYGYQDESGGESVLPPQRPSFKDIEAQPIRDDVTMQIFSEPLDEEESSEARGFFSNLFGRKKKKRKRKRVEVIQDDDKLDEKSTSIADTESWTTEEVDAEDDYDVEEFDDNDDDDDEQKHSDDELLPKSDNTRKRKTKESRFKSIFGSIGKILSFKKKKKKEKKAKEFPIEHENKNDDSEENRENSSSSISSTYDENRELLPLKDIDAPTLRKRNNRIVRDSEVQQQQHQEAAFINEPAQQQQITKKPDQKEYRYAHEMKFETQELPRHLKSIGNNTKYYEIDESSSRESPLEKRSTQPFDTPSDTRSSSVDSDPSRDRRSTTSDVDNDSYIYTSENNDKRYETRSSSSSSFLPDDWILSEMSSDFFDHEKTYHHDNDRATTQISKEDEDSDEKGTKYSEKKIFYRKNKLHEDSEKIPIKITDSLRKDKVEKENANARKRSSLILEKSLSSDYDNDNVVALKKVDKSIGVRGSDIERSLKQDEGRRFTKSNYAQQRREWEPIDKKDESEVSTVVTTKSSAEQPATRDQGTYVRLKTKKLK